MAAEQQIERERGLLIKAWECAFSKKSVTYLSGPITTGPRFLHWYAHEGRSFRPGREAYARSLRRFVIDPNTADVVRAAVKLRARQQQPVLEPASLVMEGWSQKDYHGLWAEAIDRFAGLVVLIPGWEYSSGCALEFHRAIVRRIPIETLDGHRMSKRMGKQAIAEAVKQFAALRVPSGQLPEVLGLLQSHHSRAAQ